MLFGYLTLATALIISLSAAVYSILGLTAIFAAAFWPIVIMGGSLEVGKIVTTLWLHKYWNKAELQYKVYLCSAVAVLMFLTSMGVFGFLSKAHSDQALVSGDVTSKLEIYDEKIKTAKENIESDRKQLKQMDEAVDQILARSTTEGGADKANAVRKSQQRDRSSLAKDIESNQKVIADLNEQSAPIRAENRKVEAEVGPIKYIAAFIYGANPDASLLESAVTWIIIMIVIVFDPLAVIMLLASQMTFAWAREQKEEEHPTIAELDTFVGEKPTKEELEQITDPEAPPLEEKVEVKPAPMVSTVVPMEEIVLPTVVTQFALPDVEVPDTPVTEEEASELEKWNKMIEEAERQLAQEIEKEQEAKVEESTVEERVARGETYINNEGDEVSAIDDESEESKKKTYMMKDSEGNSITMSR